MALVIKLLSGKVAYGGTTTDLYTSTGVSTIVANVRVAADTTSGTAVLKLVRGATTVNLSAPQTVPTFDRVIFKPEITLGPGDKLQVSTSVDLDCVVSGFIRS